MEIQSKDVAGYIYCITNKINNMKYIGVTTQKPEKRWSTHKWAYKSKKKIHFRKKLYRAMREYGIDNFHMEIIDTAYSKEELGEKEQKYIKEFNSRSKGYNKSDGGEGTASSVRRPVARMDKAGNIIETYNSVSDAIKWLKKAGGIKTAKQSIYCVLKGERNTTGGYKWEYM